MLCVWAHDCDPGRVSDGSRLVLTKLSLSSGLLYFSGSMRALCDCFYIFVVLVLFLFVFLLSCSLVGALKMFS